MATKAVTPVVAATATKTRVAPEVTPVTTSLPIPEKKRGGFRSHYDFTILTEVGASFGIKNKTAKQINPIVSKENRRHKNADKTYKIKYEVFDVDAKSDPDGAQCRVYRTI